MIILTSPTGNCPDKICTHNYKVEAIVSGFPAMSFLSDLVSKDIDCATIVPPSPAPVLNPALAYCKSGDSCIYNSWTASNNIVYYSFRRNGPELIKRLENFHEDSAVQSGYNYTYQVIAYGRGGNSTTSPNFQTITAVECMPPSASTLTVTPDCENGEPVANLSWTQTTNTEAYEIWRATTTADHLFSFDDF